MSRIVESLYGIYNLNEDASKTTREKLVDRCWDYMDHDSGTWSEIIWAFSKVLGISEDEAKKLNTFEAFEKYPDEGFLGDISTEDIKKVVDYYEGRIPKEALTENIEEACCDKKQVKEGCDKKLEEDMSSAEMFRDAAEFIEKWCDFIGDKDQFLDIMSDAWDEKL